MKALLLWLSGKKTIIMGIIWATVTLLVKKNYIDLDVSFYIATILGLLGYTAGQATKQIYNK
jgi:hypothetical protein